MTDSYKVVSSADGDVDPESQQIVDLDADTIEEDKRDDERITIDPDEREPNPSTEKNRNESGGSIAQISQSMSKQLSRSISLNTKLRHAGTVLEWTGIQYSVPTAAAATGKGKDDAGAAPSRKVLLHPMHGEARPGELLAVMGTSGAGKSTLLDVLSGRLESEDVNGTMGWHSKPLRMFIR